MRWLLMLRLLKLLKLPLLQGGAFDKMSTPLKLLRLLLMQRRNDKAAPENQGRRASGSAPRFLWGVHWELRNMPRWPLPQHSAEQAAGSHECMVLRLPC